MNISIELNCRLILFYKIRGLKSEKIPKNFNCYGDFILYIDRCIIIK